MGGVGACPLEKLRAKVVFIVKEVPRCVLVRPLRDQCEAATRSETKFVTFGVPQPVAKS